MSTINESRDIKDITRVILRDYGQLFITQGEEESLRIEGQEEVVRTVVTYVNNGELVLDIQTGWFDKALNALTSTFEGQSLKYHLSVKKLEGIYISGAGRVKMQGLKTPSIYITLKGAGELILSDLEAGLIDVEMPGAGVISLSGKTDILQVAMKGAGSLDAPKLETREARVSMRGVGKASVWATQSLDATVDGVGAIDYYGNPQVRQNITGLGKVNKRG
jgi:hypothetical protein